MNARALIVIYFGFWGVIAAGVMYFTTEAGYPFWLGSGLACLLFILGNGSLAYVFRARQLRREGKQPPSYLIYLLFPKGVGQTVVVPRPLRIFLGIVISLGAITLVVAGGLIVTDPKVPHPVIAFIMLLVLGMTFAYVGMRLLVLKNGESLFRRGL